MLRCGGALVNDLLQTACAGSRAIHPDRAFMTICDHEAMKKKTTGGRKTAAGGGRNAGPGRAGGPAKAAGKTGKKGAPRPQGAAPRPAWMPEPPPRGFK